MSTLCMLSTKTESVHVSFVCAMGVHLVNIVCVRVPRARVCIRKICRCDMGYQDDHLKKSAITADSGFEVTTMIFFWPIISYYVDSLLAASAI